MREILGFHRAAGGIPLTLPKPSLAIEMLSCYTVKGAKFSAPNYLKMNVLVSPSTITLVGSEPPCLSPFRVNIREARIQGLIVKNS